MRIVALWDSCQKEYHHHLYPARLEVSSCGPYSRLPFISSPTNSAYYSLTRSNIRPMTRIKRLRQRTLLSIPYSVRRIVRPPGTKDACQTCVIASIAAKCCTLALEFLRMTSVTCVSNLGLVLIHLERNIQIQGFHGTKRRQSNKLFKPTTRSVSALQGPTHPRRQRFSCLKHIY